MLSNMPPSSGATHEPPIKRLRYSTSLSAPMCLLRMSFPAENHRRRLRDGRGLHGQIAVHGLASEHRQQDLGLGNFVGGRLEQIPVEHDQVRTLADHQR